MATEIQFEKLLWSDETKVNFLTYMQKIKAKMNIHIKLHNIYIKSE